MPSPRTELLWTAGDTPGELQAMLRRLGEEYRIREAGPPSPAGSDAPPGRIHLQLRHEAGREAAVITRQGSLAVVRYGRLSQAGRALGSLLSGLVEDGATVTERPAFSTLGILLDCGHNATLAPHHLRKWLRRLALLGFDTLMLYTEAGYLLPDEPCFGYMRGAYTAEELRELDGYAAGLGIEMVGAIQALGHLEQVLRWPAYAGIRDTEHTLLVGDPKTCELTEKMVAYWAGVFRSRRLHLGMDETYDLGRGGYLDRHGYRPALEIYADHLCQVAAACRAHGIRPMIWSDVLFRLAGTPGAHYDTESRIPDEVRQALPEDVELVYWDYYSEDSEHYRERIRKHRELGYEPVVASGVWSWPTPWHDWRRTERCAGACIEACRAEGLRELVFTLWSDDGAYWEVDSSLAGLAFVAEKCYGDGAVIEETLARRFQAVCGSDLALQRAASEINEPLQACSVLWDDPLLAMYLRYEAREGTDRLREASEHYQALARDLCSHREDAAAGDLEHAGRVAQLLGVKTALAARLFDAYAAGDQANLGGVRVDAISAAKLIEKVSRSFRDLWLERCKPFGLEVLQTRLAGQAARYRELETRLGQYLEGDVDTIPELDEAARGAYLPARSLSYRYLATGARVF